MQQYSFKNGHTTFFEHIMPMSAKTQSFTAVYTHGFCSDPWGKKPEEIKKWCIDFGMGFLRYELAGHGSDAARFEETTLNTYKEQLFELIEDEVKGDIVLAGASLGGWLSLLGACWFQERVKGVLGLAAAPDFLKKYFEAYFKPEHKEILEKYGKIEFPANDFTYVITKAMLQSADGNIMLDKESIDYNGKVRLIQGMKDASLDWRTAPLIAAKLKGDDVKTVLLKDSGHRLNDDAAIEEIRRALCDFTV